MWVAQCEDAVVGCVALKHNALCDEGELVRMAVSKSLRGGGVGHQLYAALEAHCRVLGVHRVHLMTANPNSASFYHRKCGFAILAEKPTVRGSSVFNVFHLAQSIRSSQLAG
jgi:N-acetylglutamate synthase-like GNAT family acetyltransferase